MDYSDITGVALHCTATRTLTLEGLLRYYGCNRSPRSHAYTKRGRITEILRMSHVQRHKHQPWKEYSHIMGVTVHRTAPRTLTL